MANGYMKMNDIVERLDILYNNEMQWENVWEIAEDASSEIARLREENEKMKYFLRHNVFAEKQYGVYFICGEGGEKDQNGIPEQIHVCPAYGSDVVYLFTRGNK